MAKKSVIDKSKAIKPSDAEIVQDIFNRRKFVEDCKYFMNKEGLAEIKKIAMNREDKNNFKALELICSYAFGKPKQGIELTGEDGEAIRVTLEGKLADWAK
jgi:hypothetical protein